LFDLAGHDLAVLVMDPKAPHALVDGQYAERRSSCFDAAARLGVESLREVSVHSLETALLALDDPLLGWLEGSKEHTSGFPGTLDRSGFDWVTSHSFRKTMATLLDQAGLSTRVIAEQLGHARPSMTQHVYMGRKAVDPRAVAALEEALGHWEAGLRTSRQTQKMGIRWVCGF
jgi:galactokinase